MILLSNTAADHHRAGRLRSDGGRAAPIRADHGVATASRRRERWANRRRILVVEARFYADVADELRRGAVAADRPAGAGYETVSVPGALRDPGRDRAWRCVPDERRAPFDGYVALGCVIRGETTHYDYVCGESAHGLQTLPSAMICRSATAS